MGDIARKKKRQFKKEKKRKKEKEKAPSPSLCCLSQMAQCMPPGVLHSLRVLAVL
ncbi:hypothetical protein IF2G_02065 [Cordyceps javanica]|nr:hypothetical protein IF2G_02065 [Cordyceps javanica]